MRKNPHGRILKGEPKEQHIFLQKKKKEQHLNTILKSCSYINICSHLEVQIIIIIIIIYHICYKKSHYRHMIC